MEQTITMMTEDDTPEVGPNDIVIHLVNPYKCGMCELEFLDKAVFKEHMFVHLEQIKQEHPSSQIVMNISLPPETPGGVTVTRDILQLGEDGSIKQVLQPTNITLNQVSPLRELEEAGVIKLELPKPEPLVHKAEPLTKIKTLVNNATPASVNSTKIMQQGQTLGLIQGGVINIEGTAEVEGLLKEGLVKDEEVGESEVSQIVDNKDGSFSFAFKGPNDEMQHIQIIRPEGMKGDLMMELTNVQGRRRASRGSGSKSNECDICGKILSSSTNLLRHKMYHSAERPFVCDVCNKGFKDVSNLKKHTMIHKRIYSCFLCRKSFLRKSLLAAHLNRHESRTTFVKTGNTTKEINMRTFVDPDGTRVEEMSMAALEGQTFEYKHRIVKADPTGPEQDANKKVEAEKKELGVSDAGTSTDSDHDILVAAAAGDEVVIQKPMFTVTMGGLQAANVSQSGSMINVQSSLPGSAAVSKSPTDGTEENINTKTPPASEDFVKMYQCGHCGKRTVQRGNMMRHLIHHLKEKPFVCDECPKQFVDKGELVKHKKTHSKPYRCPQCNGAFAHNVQLMKHLQSECLGNLENLNYTVMEDGKTYKCDICRIEMKRLGNMIKHVLTHSIGSRKASWNRNLVLNPKSETISRPSSNGSPGRPNAPYYYDSTRRAFFCGFCSKSFSQKVNVQRHVRMHTKERPYQCTDCDRSFPCANTLKRHFQMHSKPFKCDQCSCAFSRKLFLDAHLHKHNEIEKTEDTVDYGLLEDKSCYYCKHCDKKLNKKYRMMNHVRLHIDDRPFECQICNKCFSSQYLLLKHKKMHIKPFVCKICGETFTRKFFLLVHRKKIHSFFRKAVTKEEMSMSMEDTLDDSKDFLCTICGAPFARLVIKVNHEKKCREESKVMARLPDGKGFKCKICNKVATLKHNLMVHIRKHDDVVKIDTSGYITFSNDDTPSGPEDESPTQQTDKISLKPKISDTPPEKRPRLSAPKKKGNSSVVTESDGTDEEFVPAEESAEEDVDLEDEEDTRYQRTPGGYACRECRRKFTDRDTLMRHLESHGESQTEEEAQKSSVKEKENDPKKIKERHSQNDNICEQVSGLVEDKAKKELKLEQEDEVSKTGADKIKGKGRGIVSPSHLAKMTSSPKYAKTPKGRAASTPGTPSTPGKAVKIETSSEEVGIAAGNFRRPARQQKMPSRFLE